MGLVTKISKHRIKLTATCSSDFICAFSRRMDSSLLAAAVAVAAVSTVVVVVLVGRCVYMNVSGYRVTDYLVI